MLLEDIEYIAVGFPLWVACEGGRGSVIWGGEKQVGHSPGHQVFEIHGY